MAMIELPQPDDAVVSGPPWLWWAQRGEKARLAGMALPADNFDFNRLSELGFDTVVSLIGFGNYSPAPLERHAFTLHDLVNGNLPPDPVNEELEVRAAVAKVCALLDEGRNVVVHCRAGIGRTGMVIACALTARGYDPDEVIGWLDQVQKLRTKHDGWPESRWQADMVGRFAT